MNNGGQGGKPLPAPRGNEFVPPCGGRPSIFLPAEAGSGTSGHHIGVVLDCTVVQPREFLFVVVDGLVARAPVASHQSTDEALRGRTG